MNKEKLVAPVMAGVLTVTGCGSAFASSPIDKESINGGDKSVVLKDESLSINNRYDNEFKRLGISTSLIADASPITTNEIKEQIKSTDKKIIIQIDNPYYLVSGENEALKSDTCPVILNGRTMVPLRLIGESLGADVNWDGKTNSVTLKKDKKEIKVQIGNNLMKINDSTNTKEITLDAPPVVDKNGRTLVPVRAIAEGFGEKVLWDGNTNTVFIGYTEEEKNNYLNSITKTEISSDLIDLNSSIRASKFMAGGEFTNSVDDAPFAIKDKQSGAVVVFSEKDFLNTDGKISPIERSKYSAEELRQLYINKSVVSKIKDKLKSNDCVYVLNSEAYVFNDENLPIVRLGKVSEKNVGIKKYDQYGNPTTVKNTRECNACYSKTVWYKDGIYESDGTRLTHKLNTQTGQFNELTDFIMLGTQEQRMSYILSTAYYGLSKGKDGKDHANIFNLNLNEISQYINTGSDVGLTSFQVIKSQQESFVIMTGGSCGLNELYVKSIRAAVKRFDEIDPNIMKEIVEKNGLQIVSFDIESSPLFSGSTKSFALLWTSPVGKIISINQNSGTQHLSECPIDRLAGILATGIMEYLWVESRGLYALDNLEKEGFSHDSIELYKATWLLEQINKYQSKLTTIEYRTMVQDAKNDIEIYSK